MSEASTEPSQILRALRPDILDEQPVIRFDGEPATELPAWGAVVELPGVQFILHPPLQFEIAYKVPQYVIFAPYVRAAGELAIGEGVKRRVVFGAHSALVVPPETTVRARLLQSVEFLCTVLDPEFAEPVMGEAAGDGAWAPRVLQDLSDKGLSVLMNEVRRSMLADPVPSTPYLASLAAGISARVGCHFAGILGTDTGREILSPHTITRVTDLIEQELSRKIRIQELADAVGLSRSHFSRAFKRTTGQSPQDFLIARRVNRARDLLAGSDMGIDAIATTVGFSSQAHLTTAFKERVGVTPAKYRAAWKKTD